MSTLVIVQAQESAQEIPLEPPRDPSETSPE